MILFFKNSIAWPLKRLIEDPVNHWMYSAWKRKEQTTTSINDKAGIPPSQTFKNVTPHYSCGRKRWTFYSDSGAVLSYKRKRVEISVKVINTVFF